MIRSSSGGCVESSDDIFAVIREKDVQFLREEIPAHMQERYTREALVDFLLTWKLANLESEALGLSADPKLQARARIFDAGL